MNFKTFLATSATMLGLTATAALAEYPERPINMVIPYGAGGATDISARTIAEPLGAAVGKPLVMANVTGAGGATGSVAVQNATADGYTMLFARVGSHSVNPAMKATLPYTLDDFRFVTVYEINPVACAVAPSSGIEDMDGLIAKVAEGGVSYSGAVRLMLHGLRKGRQADPSGREKAAPLGEGGGTVLLEDRARGEATFLVEVVVNRGVDGGKFLQTSHLPEALHRPFPPSEWQM